MNLSDAELERFARHIFLREIGASGQARLRAARVLMVGAGGLGSPALLYLAAAGVGTLGIADDDTVALSNLQRQIAHGTADIGRPKIASAQDAVRRIDPALQTELHRVRVNVENAAALVARYDLVLDGSDNADTRFALHDACFRTGRTLVSAAVIEFDGQLSTWKAHVRAPGGGQLHPCYRCLYPDPPPPEEVARCTEAGVIGALTGVMGALQALEAVKEMTGAGESMAGRLLLVDALATSFRTVRVRPDPSCPLCAAPA